MKKIILSLLCISALKADTFLDDYQRLVETGDGQGINLSGLEIGKMLTALSKRHKTGLNLSHTNLKKADLSNANIAFANLTGAQLHQAKMHNTDARFVNFIQAKFDDASIKNCCFDFANFYFAELHTALLNQMNRFKMALVLVATSKQSTNVAVITNNEPLTFQTGMWPAGATLTPMLLKNYHALISREKSKLLS